MYLWIDPWTRNVWLCLSDGRQVIAFLTVKWKDKLDKDERLFSMMPEIQNFVLNEKVERAFIEYPVIFKNAKSSMAIAESLWWIKSVMYSLQIPVDEVFVQAVKKEVWAMKKEDIIAKTMVECETNNRVKPSTEHEADAYWILKTWLKKYQVSKLLGKTE